MAKKIFFKSIVIVTGLLMQVNLWALTVHVETAGTLPTLIDASQKYRITNLTLTGNLNGTDIRFIREMAGRDAKGSTDGNGHVGYPYGQTTNGILANLDLSGANIVRGGDYYLLYGGASAYYAEDNRISPYMFCTCDKLENVILPNSVTSIGDEAFGGCRGLTSITIGNNVTSIDSWAFNSTGLTSVTIPNSVTSIGSLAFAGSDLTSITIPNSVTSIGNDVFWGCTALTSVTIGDSVTSIGSLVFGNCTGLTEIIVSEKNQHYSAVDAVLFNKDKTAIIVCPESKLGSYTIPNSVISIEDFAFRHCTGLTSIIIGNSVTSIGDYAFSGCAGLTNVTFGNSVTLIGDEAFGDCTGLTSITIPNSVTSIGMSAFFGCSGLTSVTLGNSVASIDHSAFGYCTGLTSITIPESVASIKEQAFFSCRGLNEFIVSEQNQNYSVADGVLFNKDKTEIIAFSMNKSGSYAIPNGVASIGNWIFYDCHGLTSVTIPNSVTSIGDYAFLFCTGLTSVTIGNNVASIGTSAFDGCSELREVYSKNPTPPQLSWFSFWDMNSEVKLYVPKGSIREYQNATGWKDFFCIIEEDVTAINPINNSNIIVKSTSNGITIEAKKITPLTIYDLSGQKVYQSVITGNMTIALNKGVYIVRVKNESKKIIIK